MTPDHEEVDRRKAEIDSYAPAEMARRVEETGVKKAKLDAGSTLALSVLAGAFIALVCLAVWLCFSARGVIDKIAAIVFPITAFVALGFEYSVANMYFIPYGILLKGEAEVVSARGCRTGDLERVSWEGFGHNLFPVTLGNIVGGGVMVAAMYWLVYLRPRKSE